MLVEGPCPTVKCRHLFLQIISTAAKKLKQISSGNKSEGLKKRKNEEEGKDENEPVKPEHMKKKERKVMRQSNRSNYELSREAKSVWNELRRMDLKADRRKELSNQLYDMIKGKSGKVRRRNGLFD